MEAMEFFRGVDLFKCLSDYELERLSRLAVKVAFPDGDIIKEWDTSDGLYIVESGMAKVTKSATDLGGIEAVLATLRPGSHFGEISLVDGLPRSATVTAMGPVTCYFLPRDAFIGALMETPELALAMLKAFAYMVRSSDIWASCIIDPRHYRGSRPLGLVGRAID